MNNARNLLTVLFLVICIAPGFAEIPEAAITPENAKAQVIKCDVFILPMKNSPYGRIHGVLISFESKKLTDSFDVGVQVWSAGQYVATFTPARVSLANIPLAFRAASQKGIGFYFEATETTLQGSSVSFVYEKRGYTLMLRDWLNVKKIEPPEPTKAR